MEPRQIKMPAELDAALAAPTFLLFKHSLVCPTSAAAFRECVAFAAANPAVPTAWLDVIASRPLARRAADLTGVTHESPQVILQRGGRVVWHASHHEITRKSLADRVL